MDLNKYSLLAIDSLASHAQLKLYFANQENINKYSGTEDEGTFLDITQSSGIPIEDEEGNENSQLSFCTIFFDYNKDGFQDIYLANDKTDNINRLYKNLGNGTFEDVSVASGSGIAVNAMTTTLGDYNNDGLMDLAVIGQNDDIGNITKIYENKNGSFQDLNLANRAFRYGDVKWVDLNNDGWLDLSIIGQSGAAVVYQQLINNKGVFEVSTPTSVAGLKFANMTFGDYNNNGTLDMFTTGQDVNGNPKSFLYQNDGKGNFKVDPEFNAYFAVPDMFDADARFLDYDLDGDLDLIYSGTGSGGFPQGGIRVNTLLDPKITTNNYGQSNNNGYTYGMNLQMRNTKLDIADMDGDGDIDYEDVIREEIRSRGKQKHVSFFGFTGTPKNKTLELFGRKNESGRFVSFHTYPMEQSIYEGFTLDVLQN